MARMETGQPIFDYFFESQSGSLHIRATINSVLMNDHLYQSRSFIGPGRIVSQFPVNAENNIVLGIDLNPCISGKQGAYKPDPVIDKGFYHNDPFI